MAFIVNDVTIEAKHGLGYVTLHETDNGQNRVVYVVVPLPKRSRLTAAMRAKAARAAAKEALQTAATAL